MCEAWRVAVSRSHDDRVRDHRSGDRSLARTIVVFARSSTPSRGAVDDDRARGVPTRAGADAARDDFGDARGGVKRARRAGDEVRASLADGDARTSDSRRRKLGSFARGLTDARARFGFRKRSDGDDEPSVRRAIRAALEANVQKTKCPAVLRLVFHDAGTYLASAKDGGMNASVRYELNRPESFGLKRGLNVVKSAYDALDGTAAAGKVSFADMIACAGAYAVEFTGGPAFLERVPLGRIDVETADPENRMPEQTLGGKEMREHFARSGITTRDMVALAGAHTIGGKGFGDAYTFDNAYYATLVADPWHKANMTKDEAEMAEHIGLPSDKYMREDAESMEWIQKYANDQDAFFVDFVDAYIRLAALGAEFA